ncbi:lipid II flippase Amj family protein [Desulfofalx alkaliphila]|uniref:lipid II flippase Amj family protein n=1 Tax=Desulfofalx alkaliphila TaxID=105483 RepID=UPI0004E0BE5B|nr:lipid II flippase Amj family protein [Desulfofalx alkaliphila]
MTRLILAAILTALIHLINTLIYSVRPAGVHTKRLAIAYSLFNVIFLFASTANMVLAPLLSSIVEHGIQRASAASPGVDISGIVNTALYQQELAALNQDIRLVILAATAGTLVGIIFIPTFVRVFVRGIMLFDEIKSVPKMLLMLLFSPRRIISLLRSFELPGKDMVRRARAKKANLPKTFLWMNFFANAIFTTSVLSAMYAGALFPEFRATSVVLSGVVNGFATLMFVMVVDPTAAMITDQALRGERDEYDVKQMSFYLALTRLGGTVLAQAIFVPAALLIQYVAMFIAHPPF